MQISRNELNNVLRAYLSKPGEAQKAGDHAAAANQKKGPGGPAGDDFTLSPQAQEIRRLVDMVAGLPDVRDDRVREVKQQLDKGAYQVDGAQVAQQVLSRVVGDKLA